MIAVLFRSDVDFPRSWCSFEIALLDWRMYPSIRLTLSPDSSSPRYPRKLCTRLYLWTSFLLGPVLTTL